MKLIILLVLLFPILASSEVVEIEDGKIEGTLLKSRMENFFHAFYRIPFAAPPLNELRFQAPQSITKWSGILNGGSKGPACYQNPGREFMSEDCLQLNVFSKNLTDLKPVVVWVHYGAYETGTANDFNPEALIDRELVIVSTNYRLGAFGFLAMGTKEVPGNAGMKDQVMALKWVQKNIAKFGGDKNKVTLAGYSAGAMSVTAHLASPMSQNFFHRAIAMSGSITTSIPLKRNHNELSRILGENLNCQSTKLLECLKMANPHQLLSPVKEFPQCEVVIWFPVVEDNFGQERFFLEDPSETFSSGTFNRVQIIAGRTEYEFNFLTHGIFSSPLAKVLNENFNKAAPKCFFYWPNKKKSDEMSAKFRTFLPETIDSSSSNEINNLISDGLISYPVHKFVQLVTNFIDVYYYEMMGHNHGSDFRLVSSSIKYSASNRDNLMLERMTKIFESFALTGTPNYDGAEFNWHKHDSQNQYCIKLDRNITEENGLNLDRFKVWTEISTVEKELRTDSSWVQALAITFLLLIAVFVYVSNRLKLLRRKKCKNVQVFDDSETEKGENENDLETAELLESEKKPRQGIAKSYKKHLRVHSLAEVFQDEESKAKKRQF